MSDSPLIRALREPAAYPFAVGRVELLQTHISWLLFAGERVYKLKKPVDLGFLDYSTLALRRRFCEEEVRLNRRLAPRIYRGVVPIVADDGRIRIGVAGEADDAIEWAVEMERLPAARMMDRLLDDGSFSRDQALELVTLLSRFHAEADGDEEVRRHGTPQANARQVLGNLEQIAGLRGRVGDVGSDELFATTVRAARRFLDERAEAIERRLADGRVREGHGDLHAGNICFLDDGVVVYDCIEFSALYRCNDVACDLAFLAMDLDHRGYVETSDIVVAAYTERTRDDSLDTVLAFYKSYRAAVRAKVALLTALDGGDRARIDQACRYLQLAAAYVLPPIAVLTCGLPGSGKSHAARAIARSLGAVRLQSDVVRKQLAGLTPLERGGSELYTARMNERTYDALRARMLDSLDEGRSAIVDATFSRRVDRERFAGAAARHGHRLFVLHVDTDEATVRRRLTERVQRGDDPSDAGPELYDRARRSFEPPDEVAGGRRVLFSSGIESARTLLEQASD